MSKPRQCVVPTATSIYRNIKIPDKQKRSKSLPQDGVIRLTEYHAILIRLRWVICASRVLRRIEYHCEAQLNNITAQRAISLLALAKNITHRKQKRESFALLSLLFLSPVSHLYYKYIGLCPYPSFNFSDKVNNLSKAEAFLQSTEIMTSHVTYGVVAAFWWSCMWFAALPRIILKHGIRHSAHFLLQHTVVSLLFHKELTNRAKKGIM